MMMMKMIKRKEIVGRKTNKQTRSCFADQNLTRVHDRRARNGYTYLYTNTRTKEKGIGH